MGYQENRLAVPEPIDTDFLTFFTCCRGRAASKERQKGNVNMANNQILIPSEAKKLAESLSDDELHERIINEWNIAVDLTPDKIGGNVALDGYEFKDAAKIMRRRWKMIEELAEVLDIRERGGTD